MTQLQQGPGAWDFAMFNFSMTPFAEGNEITQMVSGFVITVEQSIRFNVVNIYNCLMIWVLLFATYLTAPSIAQKSGFPLLAPRCAASAVVVNIVAILVHWVVLSAFVVRHILSHALAGTKTALAIAAILNLVNTKRHTTYCAVNHNVILRPLPMRTGIKFAPLLRGMRTFGTAINQLFALQAFKCASTLRTLLSDGSTRAISCTSAFDAAIFLLGMVRIAKGVAACWANLIQVFKLCLVGAFTRAIFTRSVGARIGEILAAITTNSSLHSILTDAISHDVCSQGGVSAAFSGISLGYKSILPQSGAES